MIRPQSYPLFAVVKDCENPAEIEQEVYAITGWLDDEEDPSETQAILVELTGTQKKRALSTVGYQDVPYAVFTTEKAAREFLIKERG